MVSNMFAYVPQRVYTKEYTGYDVISYGRQNTYPQEVDYAVARSGIASACHKVFSDFLYGNGLTDKVAGQAVVNPRGETLDDLVMMIAKDFAKFGGFAIRLNANILGEYTSMERECFQYVRLAIPQDRGEITHVRVSDNWAGESWRNDANSFESEKVSLFNPQTVQEEIEEAGGIEEYNGQIMYFSINHNFYPKSFFDSVIEQTITSGDLAEFDRTYVQNGFSGSLVLTNESESSSDPEFQARTDEIGKLGGVRKAGSIFYIEGKIQVLNLSQDNLTEQYEALKAHLKDDVIEALNIPPVLVSRTRQGGFPNQEEMQNAFAFYNGMTNAYRGMMSKQIAKIADHFFYTLSQTGNFEIDPVNFGA